MPDIASTPKPPYYAVIFTSTLRSNIDASLDGSDEGYSEMADKMFSLASQQPGFLGFESAREVVGISVSYWHSLASIKAWKRQSEHLEAQKLGRNIWYQQFQVRICKVERDYSFIEPQEANNAL